MEAYKDYWQSPLGLLEIVVIQESVLSLKFAQIIVPIGCGITIFYCLYHIFLTFYSIPKEESK